jgi:3-deoxy-D-manno-octulosonate 8-phosphate phosphatase (KDO 8-P phosphatase)
VTAPVSLRSALGHEVLSALARVKLVVFDFDGVFTDNFVYVSETGAEMVRCSRADGLGLEALARVGIASLILSTETNRVVTERAKKLKVPCLHGLSDKLTALNTLLDERRIDPACVAYVGNDVNDVGCLKLVGAPIVVADAHPAVLPLACLRTTRPGGRGAVREVCDLLVELAGGAA